MVHMPWQGLADEAVVVGDSGSETPSPSQSRSSNSHVRLADSEIPDQFVSWMRSKAGVGVMPEKAAFV